MLLSGRWITKAAADAAAKPLLGREGRLCRVCSMAALAAKTIGFHEWRVYFNQGSHLTRGVDSQILPSPHVLPDAVSAAAMATRA